MNSQCNVRRAATRAFIESLDQLQETLQAPGDRPAQPNPAPTRFDLSSLEQAAADIEQFIQMRQDKPS